MGGPAQGEEEIAPLMRTLRACLGGGAIGDSLGAPVEVLNVAGIRQRYGARGIRDLEAAYGRAGAVTHRTQQMLFVAEGVIRSRLRARDVGETDHVETMWGSLKRWLVTQRKHAPQRDARGDLLKMRALYARRRPEPEVLTALEGDLIGTPAKPINDLQSGGALVRVVPLLALDVSAEVRAEMACEVAALTHGDPGCMCAAGAYLQLLTALMERKPFDAALQLTRAWLLAEYPRSDLAGLLSQVLHMAGGRASANLQKLGDTREAGAALAVAVLCLLDAPSVEQALVLAVNQDGDSATVGALVGQIAGVIAGLERFPPSWCRRVELRALIEGVADHLHRHCRDAEFAALPTKHGDVQAEIGRYPLR